MIKQIDARELVSDLLPKLRATQHLIETTLSERIEQCQEPDEQQRLTTLQQEFQLEMTMIRLNLDHLLKRYTEQLETALEASEPSAGPLLSLDEHEAVAIERAQRLYRHAQEIQIG
jgi:hypothetical protein